MATGHRTDTATAVGLHLLALSHVAVSCIACFSLAHALLTAAYGISDPSGTLREMGMWELGSAARRANYLTRYMHESAKLISSASSIDAAAAKAPTLDADDERNLEKEFDKCIEM